MKNIADYDVVPQEILQKLSMDDLDRLNNLLDIDLVWLAWQVEEERYNEDTDIDTWVCLIDEASGRTNADNPVCTWDEIEERNDEYARQYFDDCISYDIPEHLEQYFDVESWVEDFIYDTTPEQNLNDDNEFYTMWVDGTEYYLITRD